jgi:chloride channel protein, CIC family
VKLGRETFERWLARAREWTIRNWRRVLRWRQRVRLSEETFHLVLAGGVGVIGGLVNLFFYLSIETVQKFALHHTGDLVEIAEILEPWQRLIYPALGGFAAGLVLHWGLRLLRGQGTTNLLEVVVAGDGRLPFRTAAIKGVSSMISIGTGASIGREGAITQLTATLASKWGQFARWQPYRLRLLVACGASAGMAAAYNAPVAGAVFAALLVLGNFSMSLFAPLVFSSVVATMLSRTFFGIEPWYKVPQFDFTELRQLPWFLVLGVIAGGLGAVFLAMLKRSEAFFERLPLPSYGKMALGGLVVGVIAFEYPQVWGNGYAATSLILTSKLSLLFVMGLFVAKLMATVAAVGSGTVGGVFTPTLFLGAGLGCTYGTALHELGLATGLPTGAFALVGMGSVLAATLHSPLLAMILVFEISLNYSLMPPLMLACVIATLVGRRLHPDSIYTGPLRAKGVGPARETDASGAAVQQTVGDLMRAPVPPVRENTPLPEIGHRFISTTFNFLPVVDEHGKLLGIVALQDLKEYLNAGDELNAIIALDVMRPAPVCLTPDRRLTDALPQILASEQRNIPVVNTLQERRLVGALARAEALDLLSEAIDSRRPSGA